MLAKILLVAVSAASLTSCASTAIAHDVPGDGVVLSTQAEIDAALAQINNGLSTFVVPTDGHAVAILAHRERDGSVEVHDAISDLLVGREGSAEILIGGTHIDGRESSPGEWRSGRIEGGRRVTLGAGDMIWIPAGIPHQMFMIDGGSVTYIALKYNAAPPMASSTQ